MTRIGIDLGGTNLRVGVVDDRHAVAHKLSRPIGSPRDPARVVELIAEAVDALAPAGLVTVGVGIAAMLRDRDGTVANSPHLQWRDVPFGELLRARLGDRARVGIYNDASAIAAGEWRAGAARGCDDALVVFVGTGIGAGVIANGQLLEGATACAGELGHTKIRWDEAAAPCACGSTGCLEAYCGGSYVAARIARERANTTPADVERLAARGDSWAYLLWSEIANLLGVGIANAVAILNCKRVVLGGGLVGNAPTLRELTTAQIEYYAPAAVAECLQIVPAALGDDAGIVGAALLVTA